MAASNAIIGWNSKVWVENSLGSGFAGSNYAEIGEITTMQPPTAKADQPETTHMQSPSRGKEFAAGMIDYGDASFDLNHIPASVSDVFLKAWLTAGDKRNVRFVYPNGHYTTFPASLTGYAPKPLSPGGVISAAVTMKVSGAAVDG